MKGLLRGIRYISQIFDEKEPEMQIGYPTDVKHVAHIGLDAPSANKPSWMNEFKYTRGLTNEELDSMEEVELSRPMPLEDTSLIKKLKHKSRRSASATTSPMSSPARKNTDGARRSSDGSKHSRRRQNSEKESPLNSPLSPNAIAKHSRRHRSANVLMDSPVRETSSTTTSGRSTRRQQQDSGVGGPKSPTHVQLAILRHSRIRKSKEPKNNASSITKDQNSLADGVHGESGGLTLGGEQKISASRLKSVLGKYEEEG